MSKKKGKGAEWEVENVLQALVIADSFNTRYGNVSLTHMPYHANHMRTQ